MKTQLTTQRGFFDLGIALIVLAIGGGTSFAVHQAHNDDVQVAQTTELTTSSDTQQKVVSDVDC